MLGFYCGEHSVSEHETKNKFHIFSIFDNKRKEVINQELPPRKLILEKACKTKGFKYQKSLVVITNHGQILFDLESTECECHDYFDDLIYNRIFPSTFDRPGKKSLTFRNWISF